MFKHDGIRLAAFEDEFQGVEKVVLAKRRPVAEKDVYRIANASGIVREIRDRCRPDVERDDRSIIVRRFYEIRKEERDRPDGFVRAGIPAARRHSESFGPFAVFE